MLEESALFGLDMKSGRRSCDGAGGVSFATNAPFGSRLPAHPL